MEYTELTNEQRAERARVTLKYYRESMGEPFENNSSEIADLIADLLHLTVRIDQGDYPVESTLTMAELHFRAECDEEQDQLETE